MRQCSQAWNLVTEEFTIDGPSGHDKQHHASGLLKLLHELLDGVGANDRLALGLMAEESVNLCDSSVECHNGESMVGL